MEYNLGSKSAVLMGNWAENRGLEALGQPARVPGGDGRLIDTSERVLNSRAGSTKEWNSEARSAMQAVLCKASKATVGPREALRQGAIAQIADDFAATKLDPTVEHVDPRTTSQSSFVAHDASKYKRSIRRPLTEEAKDSKEEELHDFHQPVTIYTARLAEGVYLKGPIKNAFSPFAKSTAFTNPIDEAPRVHAETNERGDPRAVSHLGSSTCIYATGRAASGGGGGSQRGRIPGGELAVSAMFTRFARRLGDTDLGPRRAFGYLISQLRQCDAPPAHLGTSKLALSNTSSGLAFDSENASQDIFRAVLHDLKVLLPARETECIISMCDEDGSGRVHLPLLLQHMAHTLSGPRAAHVRAVYESVGGSTGDVEVEDLASAFEPAAAPEVTSGAATEAEVLDALLRFFVESSWFGSQVSLVQFEAYIGASTAHIASDKDFVAQFTSQWRRRG